MTIKSNREQKMAGTSYTIIGGEVKNRTPHTIPWTLLVLNRGRSVYQASQAGFAEIISIESSGRRKRDLRETSAPGVKFLITETAVNVGEQINIGISAASYPFVAVIWNDMQLKTLFSPQFIREIEEGKSVCSVPMLYSHRGDLIPSIPTPAHGRRTIKTIPLIMPVSTIKSCSSWQGDMTLRSTQATGRRWTSASGAGYGESGYSSIPRSGFITPAISSRMMQP